MRVGSGHDTHRLVEGRPLVLGGIRIPHSKGLAGHSDADVVLHAITDALLGAAGLGDIGDLFPDTDPNYRDADSSQFRNGSPSPIEPRRLETGQPGHYDLRPGAETRAVQAEDPRQRGGPVQLPVDAVNVKAKTGERRRPHRPWRGDRMSCGCVD